MRETPEALARQVGDRWLAFGSRVLPGVSVAELDAFERRHGVRLPADLRALLQVVNGAEEHSWDEELVAWYPLDRWERLPKVFSPNNELANWEEYFLIGDYCLYAALFAVRLPPYPEVENPIIGYCAGAKVPVWRVAGSFTEFMEAYLRDTAVVFGP